MDDRSDGVKCSWKELNEANAKLQIRPIPHEGEVAEIDISAEVLLRGLLDLQELGAQVSYALIERTN